MSDTTLLRVEVRKTVAMDLNYTYEKLSLAVTGLASTNGTVKERLTNVFMDELHVLGEDDFPQDMQEDFNSLMQRMTHAEDTAREGTFRATMQVTSDQEAARLAGDIVALFEDLVQYTAVHQHM